MKKKLLLFVTFLYLFLIEIHAQKVNFRKYGSEQELCSNQIYEIIQDNSGFIWLGTGDGICKYNGFEFTSPFKDSVEFGAVTAMFADQKNNIWIGYQNGFVVYFNGKTYTKAYDGKSSGNSRIVSIFSLGNKVIALSQNQGLIHFENNLFTEVTAFFNNEIYFTSVKLINDSKLITGSFDGLAIIDVSAISGPSIQKSIQELEFIKIQDIEQVDDARYLIATGDEGLYELFLAGSEYEVQKINPVSDDQFLNIDIRDIFSDKSGDIWLSTFGEGVVRLKRDELNEYRVVDSYHVDNGLNSNDITRVFQDTEGNFWIGSYNNGLACLTYEAFRFYTFDDKDFNKNITALASNNEYTWYASSNGILKQSNKNSTEYSIIKNGLPNDQITTLHYDGKFLWVGTLNQGIYRINESGKVNAFSVANNTLARRINHITGSSDSLWVSTRGGIYLSLNNYSEIIHFTTDKGLSHNDINQVYVDDENNAWISTKSKGLMYLTTELKSEYIYADNLQEMEYVSLKKDKDGNVWAAIKGFGVLMFGPDTLVSFNTSSGLKSNYCYSLEIDDNHSVWVGHRLGVSEINIDNFNVKTYSTKEGIFGDCNQNAITVNPENEIVFGTTNGIIVYNPEKKDKAIILPKLNITSLKIGHGDVENSYDPSSEIVLPYNNYTIRLDFIGLYFKDPESITYQFMLEGYDENWNDLTTLRSSKFSNVKDGKYTFKLKACNAEKMCSETPLEISMTIKKPFWKTWWFIVLNLSVLVMVVVIIIKVREKKQKALQEYLQKKLDERTKEVVKQKEEIEIKNRDITDSINYAQRIQASILPSIKTLQTHFSGSFVFYQPRDIVSGDFYWFGLTKNNKFIVVCADSTGHGVPGAFMSMIGTILIKDICAREDVVKPSDILVSLDGELSNTLNQNIEAERSNDGMDITVCEIDIKTHYVRVASAMRPVIVYQNRQQIYVKGSRSSVGGHVQKEDKIFENEGFQLGKGDIIYMFSDGYPDQFGGPMEKKFKMVRLKNLLKEINQKPMDEQFSQVKNTFNVWKEGLEQVDDVLFMGIKI